MILLGLVLILGLAIPSYAKDTETYTLKVKSTGSNVNVREKPSAKSKIVGKLQKNQTVPMRTISANWGFYEVIYKGKKAYVSMDYATQVKPNQRWIGDYNNQYSTGSGVLTELFVYKKTPTHVYFVSFTGYRYDPTGGKLSGAEMPWKYNNYYGYAKLTSSTTATFNSKGCKATLKSVRNTIRVNETSKEGSCNFTRMGMYEGVEGSAYQKF